MLIRACHPTTSSILHGPPSPSRARVSRCATNSSGRYVSAMSHADQPCPQVPLGNAGDVGCKTPAGNGGAWGCEPVCCGTGCTTPSCPNSVWKGGTKIVVDMGGSGCCGELSSQAKDHAAFTGVMCCKTTAERRRSALAKAELGRQLTPINVSTYGWYYTF